MNITLSIILYCTRYQPTRLSSRGPPSTTSGGCLLIIVCSTLSFTPSVAVAVHFRLSKLLDKYRFSVLRRTNTRVNARFTFASLSLFTEQTTTAQSPSRRKLQHHQITAPSPGWARKNSRRVLSPRVLPFGSVRAMETTTKIAPIWTTRLRAATEQRM